MEVCTRNVFKGLFSYSPSLCVPFLQCFCYHLVYTIQKKKNVTETGNGGGVLWLVGRNYCPREAERGGWSITSRLLLEIFMYVVMRWVHPSSV